MVEDNNLKELLAKWAVIDAPEDFTNQVMQRIESACAAPQAATSLLQHKLMKVLIVAFVLVCIILLSLCAFTKPVILPFNVAVKLSPEYFSQVFYFLIIFWKVMIINRLISKKKLQLV